MQNIISMLIRDFNKLTKKKTNMKIWSPVKCNTLFAKYISDYTNEFVADALVAEGQILHGDMTWT